MQGKLKPKDGQPPSRDTATAPTAHRDRRRSRSSVPTEPMDVLVIDDTAYETHLTVKARRSSPWQPRDPRRVTAAIPGTILRVLVAPGDQVACGQGLLVLEAMKMANDVQAPVAGRVAALHVATGQLVARGALLVELD